ncbi:rRNA processing protein RRP7-like protein [Leptotrombidium deliense]|uniref:rRNA processing protein RRP7-like protein n=1 Tax=Leptotrombidium deliense TaxID=299467 RepID=A0A443S4D1_9ACAR|nr:rRNA processing protein RRP7-like protein [Leptotrombidium deliense]
MTGLCKYKHEYNESIIDVNELKEDIDNYMKSYDAYVEEERRIAKEKEGVPDEDGWITVSRHGKRSFIPNNEFVDNLILSKKRKYDKVLTNFYNFQRTQTKIEGLSSLRSKFEEDKKRLAMMKATRKFKPL